MQITTTSLLPRRKARAAEAYHDALWRAGHNFAAKTRKYKVEAIVYPKGEIDKSFFYTRREERDPRLINDVYEKFTKDGHIVKIRLHSGFKFLPYTRAAEISGDDLATLARGDVNSHDFMTYRKLEERQRWLKNRSQANTSAPSTAKEMKAF